ncbi:MAG: hypothetical protein FWC64_11025 [Treponema sp.]|nr:hypothetical protein [Treponema sp.]
MMRGVTANSRSYFPNVGDFCPNSPNLAHFLPLTHTHEFTKYLKEFTQNFPFFPPTPQSGSAEGNLSLFQNLTFWSSYGLLFGITGGEPPVRAPFILPRWGNAA